MADPRPGAASGLPAADLDNRPKTAVRCPARAHAYGIGTVGELLDDVARENGESPDESVILVNGRRVASIDDIEDYPPEVVSQVEVLPRGSATRIGGSANRRVFNIVLKRNAAAKVGRATLRGATDGGSSGRRGDPAEPGAGGGVVRSFGLAHGHERLDIALIDLSGSGQSVLRQLQDLSVGAYPALTAKESSLNQKLLSL